MVFTPFFMIGMFGSLTGASQDNKLPLIDKVGMPQ